MELTFEVRAEGVVQQFRLIGELARNPRPLLKRWARYLGSEVRERFDEQGPGWSPRAPETLARLSSGLTRAGDALLERDTRRNLARALRRELDTTRVAAKGGLRSIARIARIRRLLDRARQGETLGRRDERALTTARTRAAAKQAKATGPLLGRLRSSIGLKIERFSLRQFSHVPWAQVHNAGGSTGRARMPARPFLYLDAADLDALTFLAVTAMEAG